MATRIATILAVLALVLGGPLAGPAARAATGADPVADLVAELAATDRATQLAAVDALAGRRDNPGDELVELWHQTDRSDVRAMIARVLAAASATASRPCWPSPATRTAIGATTTTT